MTQVVLNPADPILLVDDEPSWIHSLSLNLEYFGNFNHVITCSDSREALGLLRTRKFSLVLLDVIMPHIDGADLLVQIGQEYPELPVVILSGLNQLETAVRCMKLGAFDYHVKTAETERLWTTIRRALELVSLNRENKELGSRLLAAELRWPQAFSAIVTRSSRMEGIFRYMEAIASSTGPVTFVGAPGSGRKLLARTLGSLYAPQGPVVACSSTSLDGGRGEELLFGTIKEPGLCEAAAGGTLLIEEIDRLSPQAQARVVDILMRNEFPVQEGAHCLPVRFRLLATSAIEPDILAAEGRFRRDLAVRLDSHRIIVPPLSERSEDIPILIAHLLDQACKDAGRNHLKCPEHLVSQLLDYSFPGNLVELRQMVERAVAASIGSRLALFPFRQAMRDARSSQHSKAHPGLIISGHFPTLAEGRKILVDQAMQRSGGSQTIAARLLGITPPALNHLLKRKSPNQND